MCCNERLTSLAQMHIHTDYKQVREMVFRWFYVGIFEVAFAEDGFQAEMRAAVPGVVKGTESTGDHPPEDLKPMGEELDGGVPRQLEEAEQAICAAPKRENNPNQ